ncbi:MAG: helix-turn-helix domain-containing protein [Candidatus Eisenbacteria bacterium]
MHCPPSASPLWKQRYTPISPLSSAATGYRIAQSIGKPAANVYKAIDTLIQKGAILVEEGEARLCRAVPPNELIGRLSSQYRERLDDARNALARLERIEEDERIYQIRNREQVLARAVGMLRHAESVALLDLFPVPLEALRGEIEAAARRGITVSVKVYQPATLDGVTVCEDPRGALVQDRWPGQWMNLVIDGREHLIGLLSHDGERVLQAIWSQSVYISWVYHSALGSELELARLQARLGTQSGSGEPGEAPVPYRTPTHGELPGYRLLMERFATGKS